MYRVSQPLAVTQFPEDEKKKKQKKKTVTNPDGTITTIKTKKSGKKKIKTTTPASKTKPVADSRPSQSKPKPKALEVGLLEIPPLIYRISIIRYSIPNFTTGSKSMSFSVSKAKINLSEKR